MKRKNFISGLTGLALMGIASGCATTDRYAHLKGHGVEYDTKNNEYAVVTFIVDETGKKKFVGEGNVWNMNNNRRVPKYMREQDVYAGKVKIEGKGALGLDHDSATMLKYIEKIGIENFKVYDINLIHDDPNDKDF